MVPTEKKKKNYPGYEDTNGEKLLAVRAVQKWLGSELPTTGDGWDVAERRRQPLGCGILTSNHTLGRERALTLTSILAYFLDCVATLLRRLIRSEWIT